MHTSLLLTTLCASALGAISASPDDAHHGPHRFHRLHKGRGNMSGGDWSRWAESFRGETPEAAPAPVNKAVEAAPAQNNVVTVWTTVWTEETVTIDPDQGGGGAPSDRPETKTVQPAPVTTSPPTEPTTSPSFAPSSSDPTSAPAPSPTPGSGGSSGFETEVLKSHNDLRAKHNAEPLSWNATLADAANSWASKCVFKHGGGVEGGFGENLAMKGGSGSDDVPSQIAMWSNEEPDYKADNPTASHYTQMVWKSTEQVGCALVQCDQIFNPPISPSHFLVCEYAPAGNVFPAEYFAKNVQ